MSKIAFAFPGVGSHYTGMGKYYYDNFKIAKQTFEEASDILKLDFPKLCFSPEMSKELNEYENSQTALVCTSMAIYRVLREQTGVIPDFCLGYSLGEYAALCCADMIQFADTLRLVRDRSQIIQTVSSEQNGTMAWTVNLMISEVEEICKKFQKEGYEVFISAYDCPDKTSISASNDIIVDVGNEVVSHGGILIPIKMSGPYHCPVMREASNQLRNKLLQYQYSSSETKVIANRNAMEYSKDDIVNNLSLQLSEPILWKQSLEFIEKKGCSCVIEIGSKNVLTYLLKRNKTHMTGYATDRSDDYAILLEDLFFKASDSRDFLAKCMVAITSTINYNEDLKEYEEKVIKPYRKLENMYEKLQAGKVLSDMSYIENAIKILNGILTAKKINNAKKTEILNKIVGEKHLKKLGDV